MTNSSVGPMSGESERSRVGALAQLLRDMGREVAYRDGKIATHALIDEIADRAADWLLARGVGVTEGPDADAVEELWHGIRAYGFAQPGLTGNSMQRAKAQADEAAAKARIERAIGALRAAGAGAAERGQG